MVTQTLLLTVTAAYKNSIPYVIAMYSGGVTFISFAKILWSNLNAAP